MEMADGIAALVERAISELSVVCTPLGGLHDCEWGDYVVRRVVTKELNSDAWNDAQTTQSTLR